MRWNVLKNKDYSTIRDATDGLPQELFNAGVRIVKHDVSIWEAKEIVMSLPKEDFVHTDKFNELILGKEIKEPGRAWKNRHQVNPFDSKLDTRKVY